MPTLRGHSPTNGKSIFTQDSMKREDAYDKAIELISKDPKHTFCEITWWLFSGYSLICWEASDDTATTFEGVLGNHVLFFSEVLFKWKDNVPLSRY